MEKFQNNDVCHQIVEDLPRKLTEAIKNSDAFKHALSFIDKCTEENKQITALNITCGDIIISFDNSATSHVNFTLHGLHEQKDFAN